MVETSRQVMEAREVDPACSDIRGRLIAILRPALSAVPWRSFPPLASLAASASRRARLRCAGRDCEYLVNEDIGMGGFCCKRCHLFFVRPNDQRHGTEGG